MCIDDIKHVSSKYTFGNHQCTSQHVGHKIFFLASQTQNELCLLSLPTPPFVSHIIHKE